MNEHSSSHRGLMPEILIGIITSMERAAARMGTDWDRLVLVAHSTTQTVTINDMIFDPVDFDARLGTVLRVDDETVRYAPLVVERQDWIDIEQQLGTWVMSLAEEPDPAIWDTLMVVIARGGNAGLTARVQVVYADQHFPAPNGMSYQQWREALGEGMDAVAHADQSLSEAPVMAVTMVHHERPGRVVSPDSQSAVMGVAVLDQLRALAGDDWCYLAFMIDARDELEPAGVVATVYDQDMRECELDLGSDLLQALQDLVVEWRSGIVQRGEPLWVMAYGMTRPDIDTGCLLAMRVDPDRQEGDEPSVREWMAQFRDEAVRSCDVIAQDPANLRSGR